MRTSAERLYSPDFHPCGLFFRRHNLTLKIRVAKLLRVVVLVAVQTPTVALEAFGKRAAPQCRCLLTIQRHFRTLFFFSSRRL